MPHDFHRDPYFKFDRKNLSILYQAAWDSWSELVAEQCRDGKTGAVMALHTAGDLIAWNPHLHALLLAGALRPDGTFVPVQICPYTLQQRFAQKVLTALQEKELITQDVVDNMNSWEHSGFSAYLGELIPANDAEQRLFVARYLKKSPVSNRRLSLNTVSGATTITLKTKRDGKIEQRDFSILSFLAELQQHIPDTWEQTSRFYGIYSCRTRGAEKENPLPCTAAHLPNSSKKPSPHWAACMKRVFEIDPLLCKKCGSIMKIKAFITEPHEIIRITENLGLQQANAPPPLQCSIPLAA